MTGRSVQVIRHIGFEDLGSFQAPLHAAGYEIEYVDVAEQEVKTLDPRAPDLLVVLGGPIGVNDQEAYPTIKEEVELLRVRLTADRPTLGICLGAQVMAAALGARVYRASQKEIGWSPLQLSATDTSNPLAPLQDVPVLHWHGDTFDLPDGCVHLASTAICENQAFSRGPHILGLQFHPEAVAARFEHWLLGHASELTTAGISPVALRRETSINGKALEEAGTRLLTEWLSRLT